MAVKVTPKAKIQTTLSRYDDFDGGVDREIDIPACGANLAVKGEHVLRLGSQNVRKMEIGNMREGCPVIGVMKAKELDVIGLQETNLNWSSDA